MDDFDTLTGSSLLLVSKVMQRIDHNAKGILFLTDEHGIFAGCVTDGDIPIIERIMKEYQSYR